MIKRATPASATNAKSPLFLMAETQTYPASLIVGKGDAAPTRYDRRKDRMRREQFRKAAEVAYALDRPLNVAFTITWSALKTAGERQEGHCLWRGERDREIYLRKELARLCQINEVSFAALWGRDIGKDMGLHVHFAMFWPSHILNVLIALLERVCGSRADFVRAPYTADVVARSVCGGWQINMIRNDKAGAIAWADYIAEQHSKHAVRPHLEGKAFGISRLLSTAIRTGVEKQPKTWNPGRKHRATQRSGSE